MTRRILCVFTIAALAGSALAALASASPSQRSIRIRIMERDSTQCQSARGCRGTFVLQPFIDGVRADRGAFSFSSTGPTKTVTRNGQTVQIDVGIDTLKGKHGQLVIQWRAESLDAGFGNVIATGTWKVVSGAGAYEGMTGAGQLAAMLPARPAKTVTTQYEGFVRT